jgi:hypothetical protein
MTMTSLNIIPRPEFPPGQCIASCQSEDPKGFVDTLLTPSLDGDHRVIVSVSWIEECARKLGFLSPDEAGELRATIDALDSEKAALERELEQADEIVGAVYTLKNNGFAQGKKPGRPAKAA